MTKIEAVIFDLGNVLVTVDWMRAAHAFCGRTGKTWMELAHFADGGHVMERFAKGELSGPDFFALAVSDIGFNGSYEEFAHIFSGIFTPIVPMIGLAESLKGQLPRYLLSNTNIMHMERILADHPFLRGFDGHVLSYEVGLLKPDPRIYEHTLHRIGLRPEQTVFLDDLEPNVQAARDLGMNAIQHREFEVTRQGLTNLGVPVI
jgi:epoxide hydrolase-like predicted phosphatase